MNQSIQILTPIGNIIITASQVGIQRVQFASLDISQVWSPIAFLTSAQTQIQAFLNGSLKVFDISLDLSEIHGFQKDVFEIIKGIAFGEILTYGQVATLLHKPAASRAVGSALARNPLPILIPCHRVVAANGHLTGYLGQKGIDTKKWLLELEGHNIVGEKLG